MEKHTVLFVDDEAHILSSIRRATIDEHFEAIFAGNAKEALQQFEERTISVIVTDMRMPEMDGLTLLKIVREKYPKTIRIVLSGYTQLSQILVTINQGEIFQFIPKPWQMEEELLITVRRAIERYELEVEKDKLQLGLAKKNLAYQKIFQEMEQKKANEKKDITNLKRLNHWIFSFWKKQTGMLSVNSEEQKEATAKFVDLIEEIQLMYIDILPTISTSKTIGELIESITKACANRIAFEGLQDSSIKIPGYHDFLAMLFKILVYLLAPDTKHTVQCSVVAECNKEKECLIRFNLSQSAAKLSPLEQNRLKIGSSLLSEIGKIYDVKLINTQTEAAVQVIWEAAKVKQAPPA